MSDANQAAVDPLTGASPTLRWWRVSGNLREDVRTVLAVHERFARETEVALGRITRSEAVANVASSEWMSFGEYVRSLGSPVVLAQVDLPGAETGMMIGLDAAIGLRIIDRLLGGSGGPAPERGPTELELDLLGDVLSAPIGAVGETLAAALTEPPQLGHLTTQSQLVRMVPLTEPVLVLAYRIGFNLAEPAEGTLSLCYPGAIVEMLLEAAGQLGDAGGEGPSGHPALRALVEELQVDLAARLQPSAVRADDLRQLRVGDVLILDHRRGDAIDLAIGDAVVLDGALGRRGRSVAVQVQGWRVAPNALIKELTQ
ncbi:MAG TPA: FliM/FliN family flagellar motor switch protein [Euzebyales bacterium]|nr:FliM/FliN family flagellar motor switch protein [Euzebyales bacterium]